MMLDLTLATNCIRAMKENGTYRGERIGRIKSSVHGMVSLICGVPCYIPDQVVLFREELDPSDFSLGEYRGMEQRPTGRLTVERPLSQEGIDQQRAKGYLLTTVGTMVGVPESYVEEIRI